MSIKQEQLKQVVNNIIKEELQNGKFPSSQTVLWRVSKYLQEHDLNKPQNQLRIARTNYPIDPEDYNTSIAEIVNDLSIVYKCLLEFQNKALQSFDQFEIEKKKYEYQVDNLEKELKEIIDANTNNAFKKSAYDIFTNMEHINFNDTDANVDINNKEVTIAKASGNSIKLHPDSRTKVSFSLPSKQGVVSRTATGDIANILNNMENMVWQQEIETSSQEEIDGTLLIEFPSIVSINQIDMSLHSIKESTLVVETSKDGEVWSVLPRYTTPIRALDKVSLIFPTMPVMKIRVIIFKSEADKLIVSKDKSQYIYLYGIKNISFYQTSYKEKSTLTSNVFDLTDSDIFTIDKVSLIADADMPNGTSINYYVALESDDPQWIPISHADDQHPKYSKVIDFHNIETAYPEIYTFDSTMSIENVRQLNNLNVNGVKFYKLGTVTDNMIIPGTERLFFGKNAWKIDTFIQERAAGYVPSAADWVGQQYNTSYSKVSGKIGVVSANQTFTANSNVRYSCSIYSSDEQKVASYKLICNLPCSIYMNGELIYTGVPNGNVNVDYYFKQGWNDILILTYTSGTTIVLDIGMDIVKKGQRMYAIGTPYKLASLFDLQYNIRNNRKDVYAITYINDEAVLVVNNYITDMDYEFFYKYTTQANTKTRILLKAELARNNSVTQLSPKLKSYTLRFL
jgi:hypothetical protein